MGLRLVRKGALAGSGGTSGGGKHVEFLLGRLEDRHALAMVVDLKHITETNVRLSIRPSEKSALLA
jgi:hypothetical protein